MVFLVTRFSPLRIHSRRPGPAIFEATTMPWRFALFLPSQLPRIFSVAPCVFCAGGTGYISAVSMKLIPRSSAQSICACPSASLFCSPQVMVPRQMSLTSSALAPSLFFFMATAIFSRRGRRPAQREGRHRLGESLEVEGAKRVELREALERRHGFAVGKDLAALRLGAEARGKIGDVADGRVVLPALEADRAQRGETLRDAHAEPELEAAALVPVSGDRREGGDHFQRRAHRLLGGPLAPHRIVLKNHHRAARGRPESAPV